MHLVIWLQRKFVQAAVLSALAAEVNGSSGRCHYDPNHHMLADEVGSYVFNILNENFKS